MKYLKYILINAVGFVFALLICQSCRHHINYGNTNEVDCQPVDTTGNSNPMQMIDYVQQRVCVSKPCFNPSNSDEFVFFRFTLDNSTYLKQLVIYNLKTKQEFVLLSDPGISGQFKWAKGNWIVFRNSGATLYKIKASGDSLTRLTFCLIHYEPEVSPDGKTIVATDRLSTESANRGDKFISIDGERLDSIPQSFYNGVNELKTWNTNDMIAAGFSNGFDTYLSLLNYKTKEFKKLTSLHNPTSGNTLNGICWHPNNREVFCCLDSTGLIKIDVNSLTATTVKNGCITRSYTYGVISVSPDGKKMLVDKTKYWYSTDKRHILFQSNIYIMDIDGSNEQKVL